MKTAAWMVVPVFALLTLAPVSVPPGGPQTVAEKTKDVAEKSKDAVVKGTKIAAEKTKDGLSKTGEVMTDAWITTRVHERFVGDDLLKGSDISVDTSKHVVTLTGTVTGPAGRTRGWSWAAFRHRREISIPPARWEKRYSSPPDQMQRDRNN